MSNPPSWGELDRAREPGDDRRGRLTIPGLQGDVDPLDEVFRDDDGAPGCSPDLPPQPCEPDT